MPKNEQKFGFEEKVYPFEKALIALLNEIRRVLRGFRHILEEKPKDRFDKIMKEIILVTWSVLSYLILRMIILR